VEILITLLNMGYAVVGALLTLVFMVIGYKIFDKITPFNTSEQLAEKNVAVGIVVGSIFRKMWPLESLWVPYLSVLASPWGLSSVWGSTSVVSHVQFKNTDCNSTFFSKMYSHKSQITKLMVS
jgi:uncharacterized membrane protein YjfL (UPF0719 family)